jgi:hypothetical protein
VELRGEIAGVGQRELPVRPGAAVAAPQGGDEAVRVEADNIILDDIWAGRLFELGPVCQATSGEQSAGDITDPSTRLPTFSLNSLCCLKAVLKGSAEAEKAA